MEAVAAHFTAATYGDDRKVYLGIAKGLSTYAVALTPEEVRKLKKVLNDAQGD